MPKFSTRKLVQISEEALPPVHAPVLIDNQFYVLTQQDVRKVEDYRLLTLHKLTPNGELKTLNSMDIEGLLQYLQQQNSLSKQNLFDVFEFVTSKINETANIQSAPEPMDISLNPYENRTKASISQQLQWDKCVNSTASFPMKYSCSTSTTEINNNRNHCLKELRTLTTCNCYKSREMLNKSTCTQDTFHDCKQLHEPLGAREKLKQKKINNSLEYIN